MKDSVVVDINKDLQWLADAHPIMNLPDGIEAFIPSDHLKNPHHIPASWRTYPEPPAYRLGRQFEDCIALLLQQSADAQLLQRNLIITGENRTLGELDCLYTNAAGECIHLELAIKFYLYRGDENALASDLVYGSETGLENFVGPGGKDRLDKKWQRLIQHQLPISSTPAAIAAMHNAGLSTPTHRQLLLTGLLFYPYQDWQTYPLANKSLSPQHNRGWWLFQHQINQLLCEAEVAFIVLPRWYWIGGLHHYESPAPLTHEELMYNVLEDSEPKMIAIIKWNTQGQCWEECSRGFIVRNDWPASHSGLGSASNNKRKGMKI
ncbi:hypothetical protein SAMN05216175_103388 [Neptunomonas qingdaonensis]|uniref:DUF1853 domain-containing protein n=1 Tax=Neptunomonas qingdaonensis TaxID=1045558 RepID=A0A1I2PK98_9GAMM|nr:hypothetical protein SAMN05216175_103388 [Neptunomonas qingdaonensis]